MHGNADVENATLPAACAVDTTPFIPRLRNNVCQLAKTARLVTATAPGGEQLQHTARLLAAVSRQHGVGQSWGHGIGADGGRGVDTAGHHAGSVASGTKSLVQLTQRRVVTGDTEWLLTEVAAHDAVPSGVILLVKLLLDEGGNVLLNVVLFQCLQGVQASIAWPQTSSCIILVTIGIN
eukprot:354266-Chlamydomonas_euryale.AAC.22